MRQIFVATLFCLIQSPLWAATDAQIGRLYDALGMTDVVEIMQQEGVAYGEDLRDELFPGRGGAAWDAVVATLYDREAMEALVRTRFADLLAEADIVPLIDFFEGDLGRRIVRLELGARRAMVDPGVEDAAQDALDEMRQQGDPRLDLLDDFIAANDLIEANVVGAMNSNYAFYTGLLEGNALQGDMSDADVLGDVWSQEPGIRADTIDWVESYLALAYRPLGDGDLKAYTALSKSDAGQTLNAAIFGAFDTMYVTISRGLGQGASQFINGEDL